MTPELIASIIWLYALGAFIAAYIAYGVKGYDMIDGTMYIGLWPIIFIISSIKFLKNQITGY